MKISLNGQETDIPEGVSLAGCLSGQGYKLETVVVEHNGAILKNEDWARVILRAHDRLEVVSFVGGG